MTGLRNLELHNCNNITNNGLAGLSGLVQLTSLSLRGCKKVTNGGVDVMQVRFGWGAASRVPCGTGGARVQPRMCWHRLLLSWFLEGLAVWGLGCMR